MKCLVPFALALTLAAQDAPFGVQSRLVLVPVNVTDAKGRTVDALESKDFFVLDNGRPRKVTVDTAATGVAPIALVVAIQTSGISKAVLEKVRRIGAMIQPLVTGERGCAAVVSFSERIDWIQECTNSEDALARAFEQVRPGAPKSARLLDAVFESIQRLRQRPNSRRVLLLISESRDRGSETALAQDAVAAQAAGVTVYAATYSAFKTAFTSKSSATGEPQIPGPKTPSEQNGTVSGGPPHCGPLRLPRSADAASGTAR
jgi:VWFA-related protein